MNAEESKYFLLGMRGGKTQMAEAWMDRMRKAGHVVKQVRRGGKPEERLGRHVDVPEGWEF